MDTQTLLELYNKVADGENRLPKMEDQTFTLKTTPIEPPLASAEEAYRALEDFSPTQGWVGFQSADRSFTAGELPPMDNETGQLLAAEAVNAKGESLHIRYDGAGGWIGARYVAEVGGDRLADMVTHIANDKANDKVNDKKLGKLRYRRFWRIDPEHGTEPCAACFIGFGKE